VIPGFVFDAVHLDKGEILADLVAALAFE